MMIGSLSYVGKNVRASVVYVLWECPAYDTIRNTFMEDLDNLLGGSFEEFSALNNFERTGFVLGCENWETYDFKALLRLLRVYFINLGY